MPEDHLLKSNGPDVAGCMILVFNKTMMESKLKISWYSGKTILFLCSFASGLVFLVSAYLKFASVEMFELNIVDVSFFSWTTASIIARLIIAIEFVLGLLLILNIRLKEFTLWFELSVLILFSIYLTGLLLFKGNQGNCNCFGSFIILTPLESLLKNIFMMAVTVVLIKKYSGFQWKFGKGIIVIMFLIAVPLSFALNPVTFSTGIQPDSIHKQESLDLGFLYSPENSKIPLVDLRKGKHILAFLSVRCPYCFLSAYKFHQLEEKVPGISIYFLFSVNDGSQKNFLQQSNTTDIPHSIIKMQDFVRMSRMELPAIFYIDNSRVIKKVNYLEINKNDIKHWLDQN